MKKYFLNILFIIITFFVIKIDSSTLFPGPKTIQQEACENEVEPSKEKCRSLETSNSQDACCYVTYKTSNGTVQRCGYLENTEFGIKIYKHIFAGYKDIKINCENKYIKNYKLISFFIIFLFI